METRMGICEDYMKEENVDKLLEKYKEQLGSYENVRGIYEKLINEYEDEMPQITTSIECDEIDVINSSTTITRWAIQTLDGLSVYITGRYSASKKCTIYLDYLDLVEGVTYKFTALVTGKDSSSPVHIQYKRNSYNEVYYQLNGSAFKTSLNCLGTRKPEWWDN